MDKNGKEPETFKHRSNFIMKALLLVLCVVAVAQFALFAKNFASLKALNDRLSATHTNTVQDETNVEQKRLISRRQ